MKKPRLVAPKFKVYRLWPSIVMLQLFSKLKLDPGELMQMGMRGDNGELMFAVN